MKKIIICFFFVITCLAIGLYFFNQKYHHSDKLTIYGNIEIRQVDLSFQVSGKIIKMFKEEGDTVKANELVAKLDDKDYVANLKVATAVVAQTKALLQDNELKFQRNRALWEKKAISQQDYDSALYELDIAKANYQAALSEEIVAKNRLEYTELYALEEGTVTVRIVEPGVTVNAGQNVYTLSKTKPVWIRAYVNESELGNVKYGMKAQVITDTKDPATQKLRTYEGHIGFISPIAEFTPKTVQSTDLRTSLVYRVRVYIDEVDEFLRQGMPVTVKIPLK